MSIENLRHLLENILLLGMPEPHGSLLVGILLGIDTKIPYTFKKELITTGTIHIVAASGFNVTIVATLCLKILSKIFNKKLALLGSYQAIWLYAWIAGFSAAVTRAAIMASIAYTAVLFGRKYLAGWSLVMTSLVMILVSPEVITSLSFWLSVSATAGILLFGGDLYSGVSQVEKSLIKEGVGGLPENRKSQRGGFLEVNLRLVKNAIKADLQTTFAAQITTLPILFVVFGYVPVLSILVNVAILWIIPIIMFLGAFKLILGLVSGYLSTTLGIILYIPLHTVVLVVQFFSKVAIVGLDLAGWVQHQGFIVKFLICLVWYMILFVWYVVFLFDRD